MKQVLTLIAVLLMGYAATAQSKGSTTAGTAATSASYTLDTNTNSDTTYFYSPDKYGAMAFTVQLVSTKVSGTVSGNGILQSTVDGVSWNNVDCPCSYGGNTVTQDSVTIANSAGAQSFQWHCNGVKAKQFRVFVPSSGTMVFGNKVLWIKD